MIQTQHRIYGGARHINTDRPLANRAANAGHDKPDLHLPTLLLLIISPSARQLTINSFLKSAGTPD